MTSEWTFSSKWLLHSSSSYRSKQQQQQQHKQNDAFSLACAQHCLADNECSLFVMVPLTATATAAAAEKRANSTSVQWQCNFHTINNYNNNNSSFKFLMPVPALLVSHEKDKRVEMMPTIVWQKKPANKYVLC
jgi:hypothetical protein